MQCYQISGLLRFRFSQSHELTTSAIKTTELGTDPFLDAQRTKNLGQF